MSVDDVDIQLSVGDMNVQLDNLFGGYSRIGNITKRDLLKFRDKELSVQKNIMNV